MKHHMLARGLLVGGMSVMALAGATGVAGADPTDPAPVPSIIDQFIVLTPALTVNPSDEGGPSTGWGGVGMYCENQFVRCQ
jgi:hypothetical protein